MKKTFTKQSYLFFLATYALAGIWLYEGMADRYSFCLSSDSPVNVLGLLAGAAALLVIPSYVQHQKGSTRAIGLFTLAFGLSVALIVVCRFFFVLPICQ